jgi:hypothetical protein
LIYLGDRQHLDIPPHSWSSCSKSDIIAWKAESDSQSALNGSIQACIVLIILQYFKCIINVI